MNDFIKKYYKIIICVLLGILLLKNCQTCSKQRTIEYNQYNYEMCLDSLSNINDYYKLEISNLKDSISKYKIQVESLNEKVEMLKNSNKYYQQTNRILVNTNSNLSNKENI